MEYRRTGVMPNEDLIAHGRLQKNDVEDTWSANVDEMESRISSDPFGDHQQHSNASFIQQHSNASFIQQHSNASFIAAEPTYDHVSQYDAGDISTEHNQSYDNSAYNVDMGRRSPHPGRATSFDSVENLSVAMPTYEERLATDALNPTAYGQGQSVGGRVEFPEGRYDSQYR